MIRLLFDLFMAMAAGTAASSARPFLRAHLGGDWYGLSLKCIGTILGLLWQTRIVRYLDGEPGQRVFLSGVLSFLAVGTGGIVSRALLVPEKGPGS